MQTVFKVDTFGGALGELFLAEECDHAFGSVLSGQESWCSNMNRRTVACHCLHLKSNSQTALHPWSSEIEE